MALPPGGLGCRMGFADEVLLDDLIRQEEDVFLGRMTKTAELWQRA